MALAGAFAVVFGVQRLVPTFKKEWCGARWDSPAVQHILLLSTAWPTRLLKGTQ